MFTFKKFLTGALALSLSQFSFGSDLTAAPKATATVEASCSLAVQDIAFGQFTPATTGTVTATGNVASKCSKGVSYSVQMNGYSEVCNNRYMISVEGNGNVLYYNVYTDPARTLIWTYSAWDGAGSSCLGTSGGAYPTLTGTGNLENTPVYAGMSANQFVPPGSYSGGVQVALYF